MAWQFVVQLFSFTSGSVALSGGGQFYVTLALAAVFAFLTLTPFGKKLQHFVYDKEYSEGQRIIIWVFAIFAYFFCIAALNASDFSPFIYFRF